MATQRAYTLRLRPLDSHDTDWRERLWKSHEAANNGAKAFGDWLLTLRGGLDHRLADDGPSQKVKDRRILLALSWLTVEDEAGAPSGLIIKDPVSVLQQILVGRGVLEKSIDEWTTDCAPSLRASIRPDAVWVNRSAAFDAVAKRCSSLTREEAWDFLEPFFGSPKAYLRPAESAGEGAEAGGEDEAKDLVQKAGGWLSRRMGSGTGADFARMAKAYQLIAAGARKAEQGKPGTALMKDIAADLAALEPTSDDADGVLSVISGPGYKSATRNHVSALAESPGLTADDLEKLVESATADALECASKVGGKGPRPYSDLIVKDVERACGFTYLNPAGAARHREFSVMLDHAARRVNVAYSWIKNAEAERRQFDTDAKRIADVPPQASAWLDAYCEGRKAASGARDSYRIRRRAVDGWDRVVDRWSRAGCRTAENRVTAARELQDDPEIDKFGDIQLFEALADDDATCVWKRDDKAAPELLKDYVFAKDAMAKCLRFKVPAYRHPDPLRHPVFIDFGNSRWDIDFSAHRAPARLGELAARAAKLRESLTHAEQKLAVTTEGKREALTGKVGRLRADLQAAEREHAVMADRHRVELRLWNGAEIEAVPLRWSSKRLVRDLALRSCSGSNSVAVARADRLGRAAVSAGTGARVAIADLFDEGDWNGRLQAPRRQLDAIARHVKEHGWDAKAQTMRQRIHWLLSFSAKLTPKGPWDELAARLNLKPDPQYWPHAALNKSRKGHARLILSRLPGLRVLSVDLGHRFAAACAVWEAITPAQMAAECQAAGAPAPAPDAMYVHLMTQDARGKQITAIYRRIGPETLPGGLPHTAPWARLDRQFLIRLQGEDRSPRKASPAELEAVKAFDGWVGRERRAEDGRPRELAVDTFMSEAVRTARLALARHARRARIAFNLTTDVRLRPGGIREALTEATRVQLLADTLADWHALATDGRWNDEPARVFWNDVLSKISHGFTAEREEPSNDDERMLKAQRKKAEEELARRLQPLARSLASDPQLPKHLHDAWEKRWKMDDDRWRRELNWLSRWLMPRGGNRRDAARRKVGGLSLSRLTTFVDFRRKVQVGYFTRLKPDGTRREIGTSFGQKTLDRIERLKDNRIKQLVSRIVEAGLGAGTERGRRWKDERGKQRDRKRRDRLYWLDDAGKEHGDRRFAPCHAIIIEDLEHYRPEETRTRRENRQTMDWKSAETRKRLEDHCQLYGLHLRDVNPQYTSRQDSRTGAPGMRCVDVEVQTFLGAPFWQKQIAQSRRKREDKKGDSRDVLLLDLFDRFKDASGPALKQRIRVPLKGGDLFVSADVLRGPIQADLNAAANIGLRALMDPDFAGKWWYVPCDSKAKSPKPDKVGGSILDGVGSLDVVKSGSEGAPVKKRGGASTKKPKDIVNLWRDPSARAITGAKDGDNWQETPAYWNAVQARVVNILRNQLPKWPTADELPF